MTTEEVLMAVTGSRGEHLRQYHREHREFIDQAMGSGHNHQAWVGGYRAHLEQFFALALSIGKVFTVEFIGSMKEVPWESVVLVGYFHDIEKMHKYSDLSNVEPWRSTRFDKDNYLRFVLRDRWGIILTEEELDAIKYVHGEGDDYRKDRRVMSPLAALCHMADVGSARILFDVK